MVDKVNHQDLLEELIEQVLVVQREKQRNSTGLVYIVHEKGFCAFWGGHTLDVSHTIHRKYTNIYDVLYSLCRAPFGSCPSFPSHCLLIPVWIYTQSSVMAKSLARAKPD